MSLACVVVNFDGGPGLLACVASALASAAVTEVLVVDNGSTDGSPELLAGLADPRLALLRAPVNDGFAGGVNRGMAATTAEVVLVLNPDTVLGEGCCEALLAEVSRTRGIAGPVLDVEQAEETWWGGTVDLLGMPLHHTTPRPPLFVQGCALAVHRETFTALGGMDERFFLFAEDIDLCWRFLRAGYPVEVVAGARAWHAGGGSVAGGYGAQGRFTTGGIRLELGARNQLAAFLVSAPAAWSLLLTPAVVAKTLALALVVAVQGRPALALRLLAGLGWNARELAETRRRRRAVPTTAAGRREASRRLHRGVMALGFLRRYGLPEMTP